MILLNRWEKKELMGWKLKINTNTNAAGRIKEWTVDKKKEQWSLMKEKREKLVAQQSI